MRVRGKVSFGLALLTTATGSSSATADEITVYRGLSDSPGWHVVHLETYGESVTVGLFGGTQEAFGGVGLHLDSPGFAEPVVWTLSYDNDYDSAKVHASLPTGSDADASVRHYRGDNGWTWGAYDELTLGSGITTLAWWAAGESEGDVYVRGPAEIRVLDEFAGTDVLLANEEHVTGVAAMSAHHEDAIGAQATIDGELELRAHGALLGTFANGGLVDDAVDFSLETPSATYECSVADPIRSATGTRRCQFGARVGAQNSLVSDGPGRYAINLTGAGVLSHGYTLNVADVPARLLL